MIDIIVHVRSKDVQLPEYQTDGSACFDIRAFFKEADVLQAYTYFNEPKSLTVDAGNSLMISPYMKVAVPTGMSWAMPHTHCVHLHPRSSLSFARGLTLCNQTGVIDSDYRDEVKILLHNYSAVCQLIVTGDRLVQGEVRKVSKPNFVTTKHLPKPDTNRTGGLGSTGLK